MTTQHKHQAIVYPESDGQPIADNTLQFEYIATLKGGLEALFRDRSEVFVAGDLLWYPVEGRPDIRTAPDVLVVFGRPKGHRGSYQQWLEADIPPQVVIEVLSPGNRAADLLRKFQFYQEHGVEEYYFYDPDRSELGGWQRVDGRLEEVLQMAGWVSPRLGVRFELSGGELEVFDGAGQRFLTYVELVKMQDQERQRADKLAAKLRALGIDPES